MKRESKLTLWHDSPQICTISGNASSKSICAINFVQKSQWSHKVRVATMTNDHDDKPHAILTLSVVPAGK